MYQNRILIVEDEVIFGIDLIEKLKDLGYQPSPKIIQYAEDVMGAVQKDQPDLVLMDIRLKGKMDGLEAAETIKPLNTPVIFLTAFSDDRTLSRAKSLEPYAFLKKPVRLEDLKITLELCLHRAKVEKKLRKAEENIKVLSGLIPICSNCKNIRDDQGFWNKLEAYFEKNIDISFTHSMCPECMEKFYGSEGWYLDMKKNGHKKQNRQEHFK